MTADRSPASNVVTSMRADVRQRFHIHTKKWIVEPSFLTPTDLATSAFVVWIALVALVSVNSPAFWCDVSGFTSNVALHGLQNGRLNPT